MLSWWWVSLDFKYGLILLLARSKNFQGNVRDCYPVVYVLRAHDGVGLGNVFDGVTCSVY